MEQNRRRTGAAYEERAAAYLESRGVQIICRNYRTRYGEIDLIGLDGPYLIFVEVKYRSSGRMGAPLEAVDSRKRQKIIQMARRYLSEHHYREDAPVRFDCVGMTPEKTEWIRNAFTA
ncbi:MAG: YraN family protein [Stomatobaculum sp.]|nr:YraN family protein [Stomatobaculum sp.]